MAKKIISFFIIIFSISAHSIELKESQFHIGAFYGFSNFSGDLGHSTSNQYEKTWLLSLRTLYWQKNKISGYFSVDTLRTETLYDGKGFPFKANDDLTILAFLFIPNICQESLGLLTCFGLGQGTVNANSNTQERDYGSWNYQLSASYVLSNKVSLEGLLKYVGKVEIKDQDNSYEFGFYTLMLGFTFSF